MLCSGRSNAQGNAAFRNNLKGPAPAEPGTRYPKRHFVCRGAGHPPDFEVKVNVRLIIFWVTICGKIEKAQTHLHAKGSGLLMRIAGDGLAAPAFIRPSSHLMQHPIVLDNAKALAYSMAMNRLDRDTRIQVLTCILEGCSIRATVRMTGVAKKTVMRLLVEAGTAAANVQSELFRDLLCRRIQVDELWGFIYCKQKNVTNEIANKNEAAGDVWLWTALDPDSKLVPCWLLGGRDAQTAHYFVNDLASRLKNRIQLTSDGHRVYLDAVENAFGCNVDYAMLVRCTATMMRQTRAIALLSASDAARPRSSGAPIRPTSVQAMLSGTTGPCGRI